ncbi:SpoIID/LytB domain-containing protein [Geofilum rubicundum]|uniref:Amidase enhancer n=1 Tax=Geofilum rubicundum JCM 15548 TaxID=1236989 RepID=A0A0E9M0Y2_9BACT|nr:SpoIID/LytB domain-containing protein [Geofilum rubicundum]GAO31213.1 amidase enhancer [Geofilum rubicundum JCM 15548]
MEEPIIKVGVLFAPEIQLTLSGTYLFNQQAFTGPLTIRQTGPGVELESTDNKISMALPLDLVPENYEACSFELHNVTIGIHFHWERQENQRFKGSLRILQEEQHLTAINLLKLEDYLVSVISSEMKATASEEFLKAHAVMSRSWLLAQIQKAGVLKETVTPYPSFTKTSDTHIRWYDREDHQHFDVCADDHCQRYQGITRATGPKVEKAVRATAGRVLMYDQQICDARFSKCCGGVTERFENVWEPVIHPYLKAFVDKTTDENETAPNLTDHRAAAQWIMDRPETFCNTNDQSVLSQVLNDYDMETQDFFRWKVTLPQSELQALLKSKIDLDLGAISEMIPLERGSSGRIIRLKIIGTQATKIIGKELEIRKALSPSHLYSSAFVVEKEGLENGLPQNFILNGAGWGHGVGLCQIGAAVMGAKGHTHAEILTHYFRDAQLIQLY